MKKTILFLSLAFTCSTLFAQNKEEAEKVVNEGIPYHDKGDFEGAIAKYDKALELDKDNLLALAEKGLSLASLKKYDEAIKCSKTVLEKYPGDKGLAIVYVTYGNALDQLKKTDESLKVYEEGIRSFPNNYQLYFNKGVTLASIQKYGEAILCLQKAVVLNPNHASSHNGIGLLSKGINKKIPALLALSRFLVLEPATNRSKINLEAVQAIMGGAAKKTGDNSVTISIDESMLGKTKKKSKRVEDDFTSIEFLMAMSSGLAYSEENKNKTDVQKFIDRFSLVCSILDETAKDNSGFYWEYYVPYFAEMSKNKMIEPFAYIAFSTTEDKAVSEWIKSHKEDIEKFYEWSDSFKWKTF